MTAVQPDAIPHTARLRGEGVTGGRLALLVLIIVPVGTFALWAWSTLSYVYSTGERAGYVQKISKKGWVCKTWEGELAMANLPGAMPEIFKFSVRNDSIARLIEKGLGKHVSMSYEEHKGVPTSCFGGNDVLHHKCSI